jgi:hypothetical protein
MNRYTTFLMSRGGEGADHEIDGIIPDLDQEIGYAARLTV